MDEKIEKIVAWLKQGAMAKLFIVSVLLIGWFWVTDWAILKDYPALPSTIFGRLLATVVVAALFLGVWVWHLYPRLRWNPEMQMWYGKRSNLPYCPSCLAKDRRSVLRMGWPGNYLHCSVDDCGKRFVNRSAYLARGPRVLPVYAEIPWPEDDELRDPH